MRHGPSPPNFASEMLAGRCRKRLSESEYLEKDEEKVLCHHRPESPIKHGVHFSEAVTMVLLPSSHKEQQESENLWYKSVDFQAMHERAQELSLAYCTAVAGTSGGNGTQRKTTSRKNLNSTPSAEEDFRGLETITGAAHMQRNRRIRFSRLAVLMTQNEQQKRPHRDEDDEEIARAYRKESARSVEEAMKRGKLYANVESEEQQEPQSEQKQERIRTMKRSLGRWQLTTTTTTLKRRPKCP